MCHGLYSYAWSRKTIQEAIFGVKIADNWGLGSGKEWALDFEILSNF